jgi:hypothetical protein
VHLLACVRSPSREGCNNELRPTNLNPVRHRCRTSVAGLHCEFTRPW